MIQKLMQDVGQLVSRYSPQGGSGLLSMADSGAEVEDSIVRKVTGNVCSLKSFLTTGATGRLFCCGFGSFFVSLVVVACDYRTVRQKNEGVCLWGQGPLSLCLLVLTDTFCFFSFVLHAL